jgi:CRISPR-associated protein Csx10
MNLYVQLQAETPLSFRSQRSQMSATTLRYIPGTNLRGALAQAHQMLKRPQDEFASFFLHDQVRFSNLYPAAFIQSRLDEENDMPVLPLPITIHSCKRFPGFTRDSDGLSPDPHGMIDALIPFALFTLDGERRPSLLAQLQTCPQCGEPLDRLPPGSFFRQGADQRFGAAKSVAGDVRTRSAISYTTGAVRPDMLYSRATIAAGSPFWGEWSVAEEIEPAFREFIDEAVAQRWLRLGNNRTRGLGRVRLNYQPCANEDTVAALHERIAQFTDQLYARARAAQIELHAPVYVPLTLMSDMILDDHLLRPRLQLSAADLAPFIGLSDVPVVYTAATARRVEGWSDLWRLPRADEWAIDMGSVFLIALPDLTETIAAGLLRLQEEGLGRRRTEGYGRVNVAHPIHIALAEVYQ